MRTKSSDILNVIQFSRASHQKHLRILQKYYEQVPLNEFVDEICSSLKRILCTNSSKNENVQRTLDFLAQFISAVTPVEEDDLLVEDALHPFLTSIITETLKYHDVAYDYVRFNACLFIRLILHRIGPETNLDNEICDIIEDAMLERTQDPKASVRLQAVMALLRLQVPTNPDCPVIKAFLSLMVDSNAAVRAEAVKTVAPYLGTIPQIVRRLRDVDAKVRCMAFRRCAELGPKYFKIVERQQILRCGLAETEERVKRVFVEQLMAKWLSAYSEDCVEFLKALKLDADEEDIANTQEVSRQIIQMMLDTVPIETATKVLSLEDKLIPLGKLSSEISTLWNITVAFLRQHDELDDVLENTLPELVTFSNYIDSLCAKIKEKEMENWEYLDSQETLNNLLEIAEGYDFSDEVGRKAMYQLTLKLMREKQMLFKVKKKIISIASQTSPKSEDFITTVCHMISDIQEPLIESPAELSEPVEDINKDCQKAELRVQIIQLSSQLEDATDRQEFLEADSLKKQIEKLRSQLDELSAVFQPPPAGSPKRGHRDDPRTVCHCLDLLVALLGLPATRRMSPPLVTVKEEFVLPLLETEVAEVNARVLNCLAIFCFFDESMVEQCVKILSIPLITYRKIPNYCKNALLISVKAIADLFHWYGESIFSCAADSAVQNATHPTNQTRRRLYNDESEENVGLQSPNKFHLESIIEVMLDMLDDEVSEIRETAAAAITKMVMNKFPVTPSLMSRIILKWYNPLTVNSSDNMQQLLGLLIVNYSNGVRGAKEVIVKAVLPILTTVANAPATSPLADVDVDNLLRFLSVITNVDDKKELVNTHLAMAHIFCYEIVKKKNAAIVHYLSKMLLLLEMPTDNSSSVKELVAELEIVVEEGNSSIDKMSKRNLLKFLERLKNSIENSQNSALATIVEETIENGDSVANESDTNNKEPPEVAEETNHIVNNPKEPSSGGNSSDRHPAALVECSEERVGEDKKRSRSGRNAISSTSSSETDGETKESSRRQGKRLKVCITRLKMPANSKFNKSVENGNISMGKGRARRRANAKGRDEVSTDSEPEEHRKKRHKLDEGGKRQAKSRTRKKIENRLSQDTNGKKDGSDTGDDAEENNVRPRRVTKNGSRLSDELNSSNDRTVLRTILHDISQTSDIRDVSSFSSSSSSKELMTSRRSLRSSTHSSNDSSPIIETMSKKMERLRQGKSALSNCSLRRSGRKIRNK